jgi:hypothetical protein
MRSGLRGRCAAGVDLLELLELPISPGLGDRVGRIPLEVETRSFEAWPAPCGRSSRASSTPTSSASCGAGKGRARDDVNRWRDEFHRLRRRRVVRVGLKLANLAEPVV